MLPENKELTRFEGYVMDRSRWTLKWREEPIALSRKSFDLLLFLIDHRDRVLNKDELLQALWPDQFVEESNLTQQIFLLRKALSRHESGAKIIETIPGRGYRFSAQVEEEPLAQSQLLISARKSTTRIAIDEEEIEAGSDNASLAQITPIRAGRRRLFVLGAPLILVLVVATGWFAWQRWLDQSGGAPVQIVLAPMEGTTGDVILDKSLIQALRMDLSQSPYVSVVPSSTVAARLAEMRHKPDEVMTPVVAREVCERTNSQGVLSGNIAKVGQHFLVTEEASSCVDGSVLGQAKYEAARTEDLPRAIDKLAAILRRKLGESRRSIARFNIPLFSQNTPSLEALKAFTQGTQLARAGKIPEAIALLKTAVTADPQFAAAYYNLAAAYATVGDDLHVREAISKAYSLKETTNKVTQYGIETMYDSEYTGDLYELVRHFQSWVDMYPNSSQAWSGLAGAQGDLGMDSDALASQLRTVELLPHSQGMLANLVMYQTKTGDLKGARATCERAIRDNLDGDGIRVRYLILAYQLHDPALLQEQRAWGKAHPQALAVLGVETEIAIAEGRFADAHKLIARIHDSQSQQGLFGPDDERSKFFAVDLMQSGDLEAGKKIFQQAPVDIEEGQEVLGLAYVGDTAKAEAALRSQEAEYPQATMPHIFWGPRTRAAIAMNGHKPAGAASLLEIARPLDKISLFIPWQRGKAYLETGQPVLAEKDFRNVINLSGSDPTSPAISLSWLGLGEALAAEDHRADAIEAYQHFFAVWAHADPDAIYLKQARQEFATLRTVTLNK